MNVLLMHFVLTFNNSIHSTACYRLKFTDKWKASKNQSMTFHRQHFLFKLEERPLLLMYQRTVTSDDHDSFLYNYICWKLETGYLLHITTTHFIVIESIVLYLCCLETGKPNLCNCVVACDPWH